MLAPATLRSGHSRLVGEAELDAYPRDGVIVLRQVFEPRWLRLLRSGIVRDLSGPGPNRSVHVGEGSRGRSLSSLCSWNVIPEFREFLFHSPAAEIAAAALGAAAVQLVEEQWFIKEAQAVDRTPWHQDQPYFDIDAPLCSIWLPLDVISKEDALEFVRGSHREGTLFLPEHLIEQLPAASAYRKVPDIEGDRARFDIASWEMQPGDCVVFSGTTLHGGAPNRTSPLPICRFSSRWAPVGARCLRRDTPWSGLPGPQGLSSAHQRAGELLDEHVYPVVGST